METDLEIADVKDRSHRCVCSINCEMGLWESFGRRIASLCNCEVGEFVSLFEI